jgi:hypothetical protein
MIGSCYEVWTHFRPLSTTRAAILRSIIFAVNKKLTDILGFFSEFAVGY